RFVARLESRDAEENHLFVAVARRRIERRQADDGRRHQPDLLMTLAPGRLLGLFSRIEAACRELPEVAVYRIAKLPDENDLPGLWHRRDDDGPRVTDHIDAHGPPVGHRHPIAIDIENFASEDPLTGQLFCVTHARS